MKKKYYTIETEPDVHVFSNGAKSCFIDKIYGYIENENTDTPIETTKERLIVGADAKRTYNRFELIYFKKDIITNLWIRTDIKRHAGILFTPVTMKKIAKLLEAF